MKKNTDQGTLPTGVIMAYPFATPPDGWLFCNGTKIDPLYQELISLLGTPYTPNLQGLILVGAGQGKDVNGNTQSFNAGSTGGEYIHSLTTEEMPPHTHVYTRGGFWGDGNVYSCDGDSWGKNSNTEATSSAGGNTADSPVVVPHNNVQPYFAVNYIIYTGNPS